MQNRPEKFGAELPLFAAASSSPQHLLGKSATNLAKIAVVLRDAPGKRLTFSQLMVKLAPLISEDKKPVENIIRVCLSTNKCFVKIPLVPDSVHSKTNYWKLDPSQVTAKMVRRHFKDLLQLFPELASKLETENVGRRGVKLDSPFSNESLLKREGPPPRAPRASPLYSVPVRVEQQPLSTHGNGVGSTSSFSWEFGEPLLRQASAGSSSSFSTWGSTHHGLAADGASEPIAWMHEPSFSGYTRASAAPYLTSPRSSYISSPGPSFALDALNFPF